MGDWGIERAGLACRHSREGGDDPATCSRGKGNATNHARGKAMARHPYHAGMFAKPDLHVAPVTPERTASVRALRVAPEQEPFAGDTGFSPADALRPETSEEARRATVRARGVQVEWDQ